MTVRVYTEITFFREEIATSNIKFRITKQLNGEIAIRQPGAKGTFDWSKLIVWGQSVIWETGQDFKITKQRNGEMAIRQAGAKSTSMQSKFLVWGQSVFWERGWD